MAYLTGSVKGTVQPFIHPHIVQNVYEFAMWITFFGVMYVGSQ